MQRESIIRVLTLQGDLDKDMQAERVLKALDSTNRLRILSYLWNKTTTVNEIATALGIPTSTVSLHIEVLEEAGLVRTELEAASRGLQKVCTRMYDKITVELPIHDLPHEEAIETALPIGHFVDCQVSPTCGLATENGIIGLLDSPASFYEPSRVNAQLIWFRQGYLEYRFPNRLPPNVHPEALRLSMEICSEAPHYNLNWPSDITLWINGQEIGTWTSPADFGGEHGNLTPEWWPPRNTQYGLLKVWHVNEQGSEVDGMRVSGVNIADLALPTSPYFTVRIGVKSDARNVGGLNLFGSRFGNYPQDLILRIGYRSLNQITN